MLSLLVCAASIAAPPPNVAYKPHDIDRDKIVSHHLNDKGKRLSSITLIKYKVYRPKLLSQYSSYGDGIVIWVDENLESDIHRKVRLLEYNLDRMLSRSELAQEHFHTLSNQTKINGKYGFTLGLIVGDHESLSLKDDSSARGLVIPLNSKAAKREGFSLVSRKGTGTSSMMIMRQSMFTRLLDSDTPPLWNELQPSHRYAELIAIPVPPRREIKAHHSFEVVISESGDAALQVVIDPVSGVLVNVETLTIEPVRESDKLRTTFFHEGSHAFTFSQGAAAPSIRNERVSKFTNIVEELDTLGVIGGSSKGTFIEMAYVNEQNARRGRSLALIRYYGEERVIGILNRWEEFEHVAFSAWEFSGGIIRQPYRQLNCGS